MAQLYVIKIQTSNKEGCWLKNGNEGDPPRTLKIENATVFANEVECAKKMVVLKKRFPGRTFILDTIEV